MTAPDLERVLAAHVDVGGMLSDEHGYQKYVCLCGEGDNDYRWHRAHVAAQLRAEVAAAQADAHVFVVRGQAGYAAGVYATLNERQGRLRRLPRGVLRIRDHRALVRVLARLVAALLPDDHDARWPA